MTMYAQTLWASYLPLVAVETYGAPTVLQIEAIRNATIELCERSMIWQETHDPYPLSVGTMSYDFNLDPGVMVVKILGGHLQGNSAPKVLPQTPEWCDENYPGWEDGAQVGRPTQVTQLTPDQFIPVPWASAGGPGGVGSTQSWIMVLRCAHKPKPDVSLGAPTFLFNDYKELIAAGALIRLLTMKGKTWANPERAGELVDAWNTGVAKANLKRAKGMGRAPVRVRASLI